MFNYFASTSYSFLGYQKQSSYNFCRSISKYLLLLLLLLLRIIIIELYDCIILCKDPFSSAAPYAKEIEHNIDFLIHRQDIRQCHFPGDQNRAEDHYIRKKPIVPTRKVNMYFSRLVPTK